MKRRTLVIGGAIGLVAIVGIVVFFVMRGGRERAFIVGFHALDDDGAIIVWRANHDESKATSWVTRVDAMGKERWTRDVPEVAMSTGGSGPVTVVDGVVVVRYGKLGPASEYDAIASAAIAWDLDGKRLWDHQLATYTPVEYEPGRFSSLRTLPTGMSDVAVGKYIISAADAGQRNVITAIEARTGTVAWTDDWNGSSYGPTLVGTSAFVVRYGHDSTLIDAATGKRQNRSGAGTGCTIGTEYVQVLERRPGLLLVAIAADQSMRTIAEPFEALDAGDNVETCGRYRDRLVFVVRGTENRFAVVITDRDGKRLQRFAVGGDFVMDDMHHHDPTRAFLASDGLPRFVPYPESVYDGKASTDSLLMLDLEAGSIAWRGKPDPHLIHGQLFRAGSRWIWIDGLAPTIAVFDGATGKLTAAAKAQSSRGIYSIGARGLRIATDDTLWIYSGDWTTPDKAPIVALDLATLKPKFPPRNIELADATSAVREKLALPTPW